MKRQRKYSPQAASLSLLARLPYQRPSIQYREMRGRHSAELRLQGMAGYRSRSERRPAQQNDVSARWRNRQFALREDLLFEDHGREQHSDRRCNERQTQSHRTREREQG